VSLPTVIDVVAVTVIAAAADALQIVTSYWAPLGTTPQLQFAGSVQPPDVVFVHVQEVCAAKVGVGRKRKERKIPKTKNVGSANFIAHKYRRNINPFKIFLWSEKSVRINKPMTKIDKETRLALIALGGAIIIFGAFFLNDFLLLFQKATDRVLTNGAEDLTTLVWKKSATTTPWQTRDSHTVFEFKNKLWLLGGIDGTTNTNGTAVHYWEMPHFNDIWSSGDGMQWTKENAVAAWPPRRSASVGELNSSLFLFGKAQ
jgi:hypothetical protein